MKMCEYLKNNKDTMPKWLKEFNAGDELDFNKILSERVLFYPGSEYDGSLVKLCNKAHFVHTYIYADYLYNKEEAIKKLTESVPFTSYICFNGYTPVEIREVSIDEVFKNTKSELVLTEKQKRDRDSFKKDEFCLVAIYERAEEMNDDHGVERFCIILLCYDAIETYERLFTKNNKPELVLIEDYGFGCNYDKFGIDGLMHKTALKNNSCPKYIICNTDHNVWSNYKREDVEPFIGGMHEYKRYLYKLNKR